MARRRASKRSRGFTLRSLLPGVPRTARELRRGRQAVDRSIAVDVATKPLGWIDRWGLVTAHVFAWAALGPSLIPRRWWMTAVALSLSQISGYLLGRTAHLGARGAWFLAKQLPVVSDVLGAGMRAEGAPRTSRRALARFALAATPSEVIGPRTRAAAASAIGALVGAGTVVSLRRSITRQAEIAGLVQARMPAGREQLIGIAAGIAAPLAALGIEWLRLVATRRIRTQLTGFAPGAVSAVIGFAIPLIAGALVSDRFVRRVWRRMLDLATADNDGDLPGIKRPLTRLRSGSPSSPVPWRLLGRHGRAFLGSGPRAAGIAFATGRDAVEPIRVFTTVRSWRSMRGAARAAASELRRTGAYERSALLLATTTGTGWLSDWSIGAFEHLTGGDCATAAMQYTVLPSGLAAIGQPTAPTNSARALLWAVEADLAQLPPERRPRVYVTGESLGAYGVLGAVESIDDLLARVDGGVLAGTPRIAKHWDALVASRDTGSPEVAPVIDGGRHIRFATRPGELDVDANGTPLGEWLPPRVAFLQHASDPIVWWSPSTAIARPDWMRERVGRDVTPAMRWIPVVSFWQLATDMPASVDTPGGYAHRYFEEYVPAWARVLGANLDDETEARIIRSIRRTLPRR